MGDQYRLNPASWSIRDWKNVAWEVIHKDRLLCSIPAFVFYMSIHSDGGGESDANVWDGQSVDPDQRHFQLYCVDERFKGDHFMPPLYFSKGIYVKIGTNVESVVVQYLPWNH